MKKQNVSWWKQKIPFVHALCWILFSILFVTGGGFSLTKACLESERHKNTASEYNLQFMIQTGSEKEILKTIIFANF